MKKYCRISIFCKCVYWRIRYYMLFGGQQRQHAHCDL